MDKYKKFYGLVIILVVVFVLIQLGINFVLPQYKVLTDVKNDIVTQQEILEKKKGQKRTVESKLKQKRDMVSKAQKKIYSPVESDLGSDSLFFTLYNDVLDMIHTNSVRIKSMDYVYNPEEDLFVQHKKDKYFVSDLNLELVSNFTNLGKLIQSIYQYPYYLKINSIKIKPYIKDKKILLTSMSLRLYAYVEPTVLDNEPIKPAKK